MRALLAVLGFYLASVLAYVVTGDRSLVAGIAGGAVGLGLGEVLRRARREHL